jgi:hypothetical protein
MVAFSRPSTPRPQHFIDCPRHPNNLRHSALTMDIVPDCLASCPMSPNYYQLAPFHAELDGLFPEPGVTDILYDLYAKKRTKLLAGDSLIVTVKNGCLYLCDHNTVVVRPAIPDMVALQIIDTTDTLLAINAQGEVHTLYGPPLPPFVLPSGPMAVIKESSQDKSDRYRYGNGKNLLLLTADGRVLQKPARAAPLMPIPFPEKVKAIFCGLNADTIIVQLVNGQLLAKGKNTEGELGCGDREPKEWAPLHLPEGKQSDDIETIEIGQRHTVLLFKNGDIFTCGNNVRGQLGCGDNRPRSLSWVQVKGLPPNIIPFSVSAGERHTMVLSADGQLWGWGENSDFQLCPPDGIHYFYPTPILLAPEHAGHIVAAVAERMHTLFLVESERGSVVYKSKHLEMEDSIRENFKVIMDLSALEAEHLGTAAALPPPSAAAAASRSRTPSPPRAP